MGALNEATVDPLLAVSDLERSLTFWAETLGGEVEVRWDSYARLRIGAGRVHLAVTGDPPPDRDIRLMPPAGRIEPGTATGEVVLTVADCRAVVAALTENGATFLGPPSEPEWGGEVRAFLLDPDGHLVEISSHDD